MLTEQTIRSRGKREPILLRNAKTRIGAKIITIKAMIDRTPLKNLPEVGVGSPRLVGKY